MAPQRLIALDQSPARLVTVHDHATQSGHAVETVCANFTNCRCRRPVSTWRSLRSASTTPRAQSRSSRRSPAAWRRAGTLVLVTRSADSYHEIDQDRRRRTRPRRDRQAEPVRELPQWRGGGDHRHCPACRTGRPPGAPVPVHRARPPRHLPGYVTQVPATRTRVASERQVGVRQEQVAWCVH